VKALATLTLVAALAACGTNRPEIPPELLANPPSAGGCDTINYPSGPYGTAVDTIAADACFRGWRNPSSAPHVESSLEDISLGSFYDPTGDTYELLLVNTAAVWCAACKNEHKTLPAHYAALAPRGLAILSALFQDNAGKPAALSDLTTWVETFHVTFPMALDPDYQLGTYASAETAPLNLVVDARNIQIMEKFVGDQSTLLWQLIEDELARREALK
jgi:hypothetical protein